MKAVWNNVIKPRFPGICSATEVAHFVLLPKHGKNNNRVHPLFHPQKPRARYTFKKQAKPLLIRHVFL